MRLLASVAAAAALVPAVTGATAAAASQSSAPPTHLGATWDAPNTTAKIYDSDAIRATVSKTVQQSATDNPVCDLYIATYTLTFTAINGHLLTSQVIEGDDFSQGFQALDTTVFAMTPDGGTIFEQAPTQQLWFLKGTQQKSSQCPPDLRTTNHVEIYVSGKGHRITHSIVRPPSKSHLAGVWTWPTGLQLFSPPRLGVDLEVYQELEQPQGPCQNTFTEIDVRVTAKQSVRIIAVGVRAPGLPIRYQNGNSDSYGLGTGQNEWFLTGTHKKSSKCPRDTLSENRIEIYTDAQSSGDEDH
ncbi:MAG TPA: hypothetical protein VFU36_17660 [Jatrophihabitans sp.]|nr:hypothetical protein [Jatrophihabitans sp.]